MNATNWNLVGSEYYKIKESRYDIVFTFIRDKIAKINPKCILDYGGGDANFSIGCAKLPIREIVTYDPSLSITKSARKNCKGIKKIKVVESTKLLSSESFDVITLNAVWMCLETTKACMRVFKDIKRLLKPNGILITSVTHPCFRNIQYSTYKTNFDMKNYLKSRTQFRVKIFDGKNDVNVIDTHWNLSDMSSQLSESGFIIDRLYELPDRQSNYKRKKGSPWLVILAKREPQKTI